MDMRQGNKNWQPLGYYMSRFEKMNCNKYAGIIAPHKAVMLLSVMQGVKRGAITNGFVPVNEWMKALYNLIWKQCIGNHWHYDCSFETPFFHLSGEPFWKLVKRDEFVEMKKYSFAALQHSFYGAMLPDSLFSYMCDASSRDKLIRVLTEKFLHGYETNGLSQFVSTPNEECTVAERVQSVVWDSAA